MLAGLQRAPAAVVSETAVEQALLERLDALREAPGPHTDYIRRMWLQAISQPDEKPGVDRPEYALPYIPVMPESLGVPLGRSATLLDIGCLGGYGVYDFCRRRDRAGLDRPGVVGIDICPGSVAIAQSMAPGWARAGAAAFCVANGESLPFDDQRFDMVVSRQVLPYGRIHPMLDEVARVLRPGGLAVIQSHAPEYYARSVLERGLYQCDLRDLAYYLRPLLSGIVLELSGRQPRNRAFAETALSRRCLIQLCRERRLTPLWDRSHAGRPIVMFRKLPAARRRHLAAVGSGPRLATITRLVVCSAPATARPPIRRPRANVG